MYRLIHHPGFRSTNITKHDSPCIFFASVQLIIMFILSLKLCISISVRLPALNSLLGHYVCNVLLHLLFSDVLSYESYARPLIVFPSFVRTAKASSFSG